MNTILRVLHTQGKLHNVRKLLNKLNSKINITKNKQIKLEDNSNSFQDMILKLRQTTNKDESIYLRNKINEMLSINNSNKLTAEDNVNKKFKYIRNIIQHSLNIIYLHLLNTAVPIKWKTKVVY